MAHEVSPLPLEAMKTRSTPASCPRSLSCAAKHGDCQPPVGRLARTPSYSRDVEAASLTLCDTTSMPSLGDMLKIGPARWASHSCTPTTTVGCLWQAGRPAQEFELIYRCSEQNVAVSVVIDPCSLSTWSDRPCVSTKLGPPWHATKNLALLCHEQIRTQHAVTLAEHWPVQIFASRTHLHTHAGG